MDYGHGLDAAKNKNTRTLAQTTQRAQAAQMKKIIDKAHEHIHHREHRGTRRKEGPDLQDGDRGKRLKTWSSATGGASWCGIDTYNIAVLK